MAKPKPPSLDNLLERFRRIVPDGTLSLYVDSQGWSYSIYIDPTREPALADREGFGSSWGHALEEELERIIMMKSKKKPKK